MKISDLTTPKDMRMNPNRESDIMAEAFEKQLKISVKGEKYYHLVIDGEYSREACTIIENAYKHAGWSKAVCRTSSEKGEREGLTGLQLYV